jgi:carboxyl-terminal processing protease
VADFRKAKENTVVSLLETKRRKERDEADQKRKALDKAITVAVSPAESKPTTGKPATDKPAAVAATTPVADATADPKKKKDLYLTEAGRILADYIALSKRDPQLTNR